MGDWTNCGAGSARRAPHAVFWVIAAALSVIAVKMVIGDGREAFFSWERRAQAQTPSSGGAGSVFAFSGPIAPNAYGVYMVDVDSMTLWCYEYQKERNCLRLAAARSWKYDRYLENYNVCEITPKDVEALIENQRAYKLRALEDAGEGP